MHNISFHTIISSETNIRDFDEQLNAPSDKWEYVDKFVSESFESAYKNFTILHAGYDKDQQKYFGFTSLRIATKIDDIPGLYIELIYLKPEYRKQINTDTMQKYSYDMLDYIFNIGLILQQNVAVNHIFLVPVTDNVRQCYRDYGFEDLPGSGSCEYEDYMVLNLIDEDSSI